MTSRVKNLIGLAGGLAVAALLWSLSGAAWGRSGSYPLARRALQTSGLPGAEGVTYRILLNVPASEKQLAEIVVSPEIFHAVQEGDTLEYRIRALPLAGIEAFGFQARRAGAAAVRWTEGYVFLFLGLGVAGLLAALVCRGIAGLVANLFRLSAPPDG